MVGIQLTNVRKKLGPNQALDGVTTTFAPGALHAAILDELAAAQRAA